MQVLGYIFSSADIILAVEHDACSLKIFEELHQTDLTLHILATRD